MLNLKAPSTVAYHAAPNDQGNNPEVPAITEAQADNWAALAVKGAASISKETLEHLGDYAATKESVARGPIVSALDAINDFGDAIVDLPEPGSKAGETGNRTPDKFTRTIGGKKKPASFYSIMFDSTVPGLIIAGKIAALDAAKDGDANPPEAFVKGIEDAPARAAFWTAIKEWDDDAISHERDRLTNQRNNQRNVFVKGIRLAKKIAEFNTRFDKVQVKLAMKSDGSNELLNTPKPIVVYDNPFTPDSKTKLYTVDTFLAKSLDATEKGGGTREAFNNAPSEGETREGSGGAGQDGRSKDTVSEIKNRNQLSKHFAVLAAYLETNDGKAEMLKLAADKDEGKAVRISLCMIADKLDSVTSKCHHEYEAWLEEQTVKSAA